VNYIQAPVTTERAVSQIERLNKIAFYCQPEATKAQVRKEAVERFKVAVKSVTTRIRPDGRKVAVLTLTKAGEAASLASKLKVL
jgi:large subunit ribosomal protein L23